MYSPRAKGKSRAYRLLLGTHDLEIRRLSLVDTAFQNRQRELKRRSPVKPKRDTARYDVTCRGASFYFVFDFIDICSLPLVPALPVPSSIGS